MQRVFASIRHTNGELNRIINNYGGVFGLELEHSDVVRQMLNVVAARLTRHRDYAEKNLYQDKPRPIDFALLSNSQLNALAYSSPIDSTPAFDFIGVNVGVIFTLSDIFGRILAHPLNFVDVGDPALETAPRSTLPFLTTDVATSEFNPVAPNCKIRSIYAGLLAQTSLDFLFFHELTHLRNGHIEFLRNGFQLNHFLEASGQARTPEEAIIRQTLESDADAGAILKTLNAAFQLKSILDSPSPSASEEILSAMRCAYGTPELAARTVNFASYILFRIFDTSEWLWDKQAQLSHPLPPLRMFLIGTTLYEIFLQRPAYEYNADKFIQDNANTILAAERACGLIRGDEPDMRGIQSVIKGHKYLKYIDDFKNQWKKIRPTLENYKRGGNLAM